VVPIGFACDNMEVVYDLDIEAAAAAREKGAHFVRAATVSTIPAFVSMVRELVEERATLWATPRRRHLRALARQLPGRPLSRQCSHGK
jgi:ferrochelatase